jgi:hypothetical protein
MKKECEYCENEFSKLYYSEKLEGEVCKDCYILLEKEGKNK